MCVSTFWIYTSVLPLRILVFLASKSTDRLCLVLLECFNDIICISRDKNKSERGVDEDEINGRRVTRQVNGEEEDFICFGE